MHHSVYPEPVEGGLKPMKQFLREYFTFNKTERNGIFVLLLIIACQLTYLIVSPYFFGKRNIDSAPLEKQIASFNAVPEPDKEKSKEDNFDALNESHVNPYLPHYFAFDPNTIANDDWEQLGLSQKQIKTINNYQKKGGKFFKKEDLKKIYGISEKQYLQLEPYIEIRDKKTPVIVPENSKPNYSIKKVNLNTADSLELVSLKGIGPFYAKTILKYRNQLGGFYSANQLLEVWKFDEEKLNTIIAAIEIDTSNINKININTCTAKQLKHPYLNWSQVNAIINYRNKHGNYNEVNEIKNTSLISDETFAKIHQYLTTQ